MKNADGSETWYTWREQVAMEGGGSRLLIPRSDPHKWEYPLDWLFDTIEDSVEYLSNEGVTRKEAEGFILCLETTVPLPDSQQPDLSELEDGEDEDEDEDGED